MRNKIFTYDIDVRFRDLDALGHVNHAVFITYFEHGRINFTKKVFNISDPSDFSFIMAHIRCDYLKPIKMNDRVTLQMWVLDIGTKSFSFGYKLVDLFNESMVYATGESVQVCYDYALGTSIPVSEEMKEKMSGYLIR